MSTGYGKASLAGLGSRVAGDRLGRAHRAEVGHDASDCMKIFSKSHGNYLDL
jgi:hypothetical protein